MPAPLSGQAPCSGTNTVVPLSATPVTCVAFVIKAPVANGAPVFIGGSGMTVNNGYQLDPGDTFGYERNTQHGGNRYELSPSDFYVTGTTGDKVTWLASP